MSNLEKIENGVKEGFQNIENGVVEGYKKIENGVVEGYKKIENGVVEGFTKISDAFVEKYLMKEGETLEEAKARINKEQEELAAKSAARANVKTPEINIPNSEEIVKKNLEASLNAGKR